MKKVLPILVSVFLFGCNNNPFKVSKEVSIDSAITALKEVGGVRYLEIGKDYESVSQKLPPFDIDFLYQKRGCNISVQILTSNDSLACLLKNELSSANIKYTCERTRIIENIYTTEILYDVYYLPIFYKAKKTSINELNKTK